MTNNNSESGLALEANAVRLVNFDPRWQALFIAETARILEALGPLARGIEHYGSTSVEGLAAKPILDILVGTDQFGDPKPFASRLEPLGYEFAHWAGVPGHQVFGLGQPRTHLLHVVRFGEVEWHQALNFRDRLRSDSNVRNAYSELKRELAAKYPTDKPRYTAEKTSFIDAVVGEQI
ncbi:MAG: GrpB family protein [Candidatus Nanopelagicales bacterium]